MEQHEERWWEAEISRLRGVLLLRQPGTPQAEAEAWLQRALDVARRQEAKSLELRAAMSLSRLWQQQGKRQEAYDLLAPIYHWFTEGFDTADLQDARALYTTHLRYFNWVEFREGKDTVRCRADRAAVPGSGYAAQYGWPRPGDSHGSSASH